MKNTLLKSLAFGLLLAAASLGFSQTILTTTTLSAAVPSTLQSTTTAGIMSVVTVASATGIAAPAGNTSGILNNITNTFLYVDKELMDVRGVSGTTLTVVRGSEGTIASNHASGALVFVIPAAAMVFNGGGPIFSGLSAPSGGCTRTNELYLPRIQFTSGVISDCVGGQWVNGDAQQTTRNSGSILYAPQPGGTIYTSLNSTGTVLAATTMYCTEIQLPYSKYVTGLEVLLGTVGATDKHLVALYDATGNLVANSATAGQTAGTASTYEQIPFTSKYYVVGPAQYFGCLQTNGTTATVRMLVTSVQDQYLTKGVTGQTFGTIPATITVPTTFTTAVGPYEALY